MSKWWEKLMGGADDAPDDTPDDTPEFELDEETGEPKLGEDGQPIPVQKKKEEAPVPTAAEIAKELHELQKAEAAENARIAAEQKKKAAKPEGEATLETMKARIAEIEDDAFQDAGLFKELQQLNRDVAKAEALADFNKTVGSRLDFADDIAVQQDLSNLMEPLDEGERAAALSYIKEKGIQPEYLKNAVVVDMIQRSAKLINFEKTGVMSEKPIPGAIGTRGKSAPDNTLQSGDEKSIVEGFERVVKRMNEKQSRENKDAKPIKLDRSELTGRKN